MHRLTIVKLGGSVITDKRKPLTAKRVEIRRLGREIQTAKYKGKLIITHGSGSFGHSVAKKYKTEEGYKDKKSIKGMVLTSDVAIGINRIVMEEFIKLGMNVKSFTPSSFVTANNKKVNKGFIDPIKKTLESDLIPVTFGDVVIDIKRGFCIFSAEKIIKFMVNNLHNEYNIASIIYCSDTDGVYDQHGTTIPEITRKNFRNIKKIVGKSEGVDVTGGMIHKVKESLKVVTKYDTNAIIINGNKKGALKLALEGKKVRGTRIH
jgi:isopentenyl phosphate kinase